MLALTALVIDDSRVMRNMVMQSLKRAMLADFTFVEAVDGADALAKFDPAAVDVCFVDWNMPNMTGIEFVRAARAKDGADRVRMVMVTSEQAVAKVEEALTAAGADAYVCKPFTPEAFQTKLAKVIAQLEEAALAASNRGFFSKLFS